MQKLSRSKLELFIDCPRCFWLDMTRRIKRPDFPPFTINNAIDFLLKREFDMHRELGTAHYLIKKFEIAAIPYNCPEINQWRHNFTGVQVEHQKSGFLVYGAVDDIWITPKKELIVVDYKATGAKEHHIYDSYRRQMEIYQWLLRERGEKVAAEGYFLFAKVNKDNGFGEGKLSFDFFLEPLNGDSSWIEGAIMNARKCLDGKMPDAGRECQYCGYVRVRGE